MPKSLYRVKLVFDTVIAAETQAEAEREGRFLAGSDFDDPPNEVEIRPIRTVDDLPNPWVLKSIPWGDHDCSRTVKDFLETKGEA